MRWPGEPEGDSVLTGPPGTGIFAGRERVPTGIRSLPFLMTGPGGKRRVRGHEGP